MLDRVNTKPKANSKPKNNSSLGEANLSLDNITFNLDIKINLESKNQIKNKKDYGSDQDEMLERINHFEKY